MADTDSYIITKTMGNLMQFVFIASNVIMAIYNQTYLRVYRLTQDSVIPPVAILTGGQRCSDHGTLVPQFWGKICQAAQFPTQIGDYTHTEWAFT